MKTITLFLNRALDRVQLEHHVAWAVARLCEGLDTPSLRILAGMDGEHSLEIDAYFRRSCRELGLDPPAWPATPRAAAFVVKLAYDLGEISGSNAWSEIMELPVNPERSDPLLGAWRERYPQLLRAEFGDRWWEADWEATRHFLDDEFPREWERFEGALRRGAPEP